MPLVGAGESSAEVEMMSEDDWEDGVLSGSLVSSVGVSPGLYTLTSKCESGP